MVGKKIEREEIRRGKPSNILAGAEAAPARQLTAQEVSGSKTDKTMRSEPRGVIEASSPTGEERTGQKEKTPSTGSKRSRKDEGAS